MSDPFEACAANLDAGGVRLRALSPDDAPEVFACAADPEVARFTLWPAPESESATRQFLGALTRPEVLSWAIVSKDAGAVVGMVFLHSLSRRHHKAEIAFAVARHHWGRGIAASAARAVVQFSFARLGLHRLEATCMPGNGGSKRVLEKIGMVREGTMRRSHWRYDGFHDMELFSLLREDEAAHPPPEAAPGPRASAGAPPPPAWGEKHPGKKS